ncbi:MAG TPA: hypothetical protein ENI09_01945 [candidate division WWE3 bacterium]|uniref:Uncharacterized protein n=1 Tax=candidate division WWE3 bacterium TaxID=2053526 RepID=A0A7C1P6F3_UNCKA|nr:hypothetical protein [candidate division WWE3 bacterium]
MVSDHHHNLIQQLSELMDSVWRYDKYYKQDAKNCKDCQDLWERLHQRHQEDIDLLKHHIAEHVEAGDW